MIVSVTYPKYLKDRVLHDLEDQQKRADLFNKKTSSGKIGKMLDVIGRVSPVFKHGFSLNYEWSKVTDTSLELKVVMPAEAFLKESILFGRIRTEFQHSYGQTVRVKLLKAG
jgi:hypothetical protein